MHTVSITKLYDILSQRLGREEAESLVDFVETKIEKNLEEKTGHLASKQDLSETKADIIKWMFGTFITLVVMILGLYATIIFKQ